MNERTTVHGPYDTDSDAMRDAAHVHQAYRVAYERGLMDRINEGLLLGTLREAGVELGAYDKRIAGWLADWEPHVVHVILGWIERARAAGHSAGNLGANWAHHVAAQRELAESVGVCGRCGQPFDPTDTRYNGRAEERSMPGYCRGCVDRCHDSEDAFHVCVICQPSERGQRDGGA